jgi:hypothetical protein
MKIIKIAQSTSGQFAKDIANLTDFTFGTIYRTFMYRKSPYFVPELFQIFYDTTLDYKQKINKAVQTLEARGYSKKGTRKSESSTEYVKEVAKRTGINPKTLSVYIGSLKHSKLKDIYRMDLPWDEKIDEAVRYCERSDVGFQLRGGVVPVWPEYQDAGEKDKWQPLLLDVQNRALDE